ncbi:multidrug efflux SMR transporter [Paucibacter sp. PLA-PC-4]|uniref:DMT family transporter n=1 Tax=Paucibacter sp. PLA-PC-4 TaxID=2993655 RepID=UPI00224A5FAE|nr:multidrug efflux SMR transporter [Paucibacter sp. PLA-PC-4]MCX2864135.1 multidrug efflux SMR transporter [Paucibacter sp. PLA-PC-4]
MRSSSTAWWLLAASVLAEVLGTVALRHADGFTRFLPSLACAALYGLAIWLMSLSVRHLDLGLAYAVWAGAGTALTACVGIWLFGESMHAPRLLGIALIVAGVAVLNLSAR